MRITKYNTKINSETRKPYLVKDVSVNYPQKSLHSPGLIVDAMNEIFDIKNMSEEYLYLLTRDCKAKLIGIFEVLHGTVNTSVASNREIFMKALLAGASNIVLVHNHPSGDCEPSKEDYNVTRCVKQASTILGINLLDHIVIGDGCFFSFKENEDI